MRSEMKLPPTYPEAIIQCGRFIFRGFVALAIIGLATYAVDKGREVMIAQASIRAQLEYQLRIEEMDRFGQARPHQYGGPGS